MKTMKLSMIAICSIAILSLSCKDDKKTEQLDSLSQEESTEQKGEHKTIFENDYAQVSKMNLESGEFLPVHEGENRVIYALTDYTIDWEEEGKNLGNKTWKKGEVHYHKAGKHAAKNNGTTKAEWLAFSRKNTDLPECGENTVDNDVSSVSPDFTKTLLDNEAFKMTLVKLPIGKSIPMHSGINRIIYSLSDYVLEYESDAHGKLDKQFKQGDTHWHEACQHALKNIGETEAEFLVVSYK